VPAIEQISITRPRATFRYPPRIVVGFLRGATFLISKVLWRLRYSGLENVPRHREGLVIVANHQTYLDPVWIAIPIQQDLRFMAWDQAFSWPLIGRVIRYLGAFPVKHRAGVTKSAIVEALRALRSGAALLIFPEGEREFADGKLLEFKSGAVHIALNAKAPVLPVSILGGNEIWPQGRSFPRIFRRVHVTFHPVMHLDEVPSGTELDEHLTELNERLVAVIESGI
jgi:1-acyl-sn-glycerol-3-phosphate acyltransferase